MAYIIVTTDDGRIVSKRHHTDYPRNDEYNTAALLNTIASAVMRAEAYTARQGRLRDADAKDTTPLPLAEGEQEKPTP